MKRTIALLICVCMLTACGNSKNEDTKITRSSSESTITDETETSSTTEDTVPDESDDDVVVDDDTIEALGDIEVNQDMLTVELVFPAGFLGDDLTQEDIDEGIAEDDGLISGVINADGSVTYVVTQEKYQEMMAGIIESLDESIQETIDSGDYPNILSVSHNGDYTDYTVEYLGNETGIDSMIVLEFYMFAGMYGVFTGETPDNVHVAFVDPDTGEVIEEANSRDMELD